MYEGRSARKLTALLAADVAGYSRLMGLDEDRTHRALTELFNQSVLPNVARYHGSILKRTGDGLMAQFQSAVDAVQCGVDIQRATDKHCVELGLEDPIRFRIGVNLGDVIVEDGEVYGDDVNVCARLEAMADPGGVFVSGAVWASVASKLPLGFEDLGEQRLHNIVHPVRVYRVVWDKAASSGAPMRPFGAGGEHGRASIAVLPFTVMGPEADQEYFADGMVEDIITALSRFKWLFVVARNSTFTYKGRAVDVKQVARDLGVRYVMEGSVRRGDRQMRITAQLIDGTSDRHIWADRFDGALSEVFDVQDRVTRAVVAAIEPKLLTAELEHSHRKPTHSLDAYDFYLRALPYRSMATATANEQALKLLHRAIELDPGFAAALAHAAMCHTARRDQGWAPPDPGDVAEGLRLASAAIAADYDDPVALCLAGHVFASLGGDLEKGIALIDRSLAINPNSAEAWARSSMVRTYGGQYETAIDHAHQCLALNPLDPNAFIPLCAAAFANLFQGRNDEAIALANAALRGKQRPPMALRILIAAHWSRRHVEEARALAQELMQVEPEFRRSAWARRSPFRKAEQTRIFLDAFTAVGLPE